MAPTVLCVGDLLLVIYLVCLSFLFQRHAHAFSFVISLYSLLRFEIPPFQKSAFLFFNIRSTPIVPFFQTGLPLTGTEPDEGLGIDY